MLAMPQVERSLRGSVSALPMTARIRQRCSCSCGRCRNAAAWRTPRWRLQYGLYTRFPRRFPARRSCPRIRRRSPVWARPAASRIQIEDVDNSGLPTLNKVGERRSRRREARSDADAGAHPTILTGPYLAAKFDRPRPSRSASRRRPFSTRSTPRPALACKLLRLRHALVSSSRSVAGGSTHVRRSDLSRVYVANNAGNMMPVSAVSPHRIDPRQRGDNALQRVQRVRDRRLTGHAGELRRCAGRDVENRSAKHLPKGMSYDWSGIARQQVQSGAQTIARFREWVCSSSSWSWSPNTRAYDHAVRHHAGGAVGAARSASAAIYLRRSSR